VRVGPLEVIRFALELCALVGLAIAGADVGWWAAILLPLAFVVVWGALIAPKAKRRLKDPARLIVELVLFAIIGAALTSAGHSGIGIALAMASGVVAVALRRAGIDA